MLYLVLWTIVVISVEKRHVLVWFLCKAKKSLTKKLILIWSMSRGIESHVPSNKVKAIKWIFNRACPKTSDVENTCHDTSDPARDYSKLVEPTFESLRPVKPTFGPFPKHETHHHFPFNSSQAQKNELPSRTQSKAEVPNLKRERETNWESDNFITFPHPILLLLHHRFDHSHWQWRRGS